MSNARNLARLLPNTSGQLPDANLAALSANKISGALAKANMAGGSVLQVVTAIKTDTQSFSGLATSWADIAGLSVTLTPMAASSRFLILGGVMTSITNNPVTLKPVRNGSDIFIGDAASNRKRASMQLYPGAGPVVGVYSTIAVVDSPNTTTPLTYKFQLSIGGTATDYVNRCGRDTDTTSEDARGASSIIVMEIAG